MPQLRELALYRCVLSTASVRVLSDVFPNLEHLVLIGGWSQRRLVQLSHELKGIKRLTVVACEATTATVRALSVHTRGLKHLDLRACHNRDPQSHPQRSRSSRSRTRNFGADFLEVEPSERAAMAPLRVTVNNHNYWLSLSQNPPQRKPYNNTAAAAAAVGTWRGGGAHGGGGSMAPSLSSRHREDLAAPGNVHRSSYAHNATGCGQCSREEGHAYRDTSRHGRHGSARHGDAH